MADKDLNTRINGRVAFELRQVVGNDVMNGSIIDMQGFDSIDFNFLSADTIDVDLTVTMKHSDDSSFATSEFVPAEFIVGTLPSYLVSNAEIDTVKSVGYVGKKRYVRVTVTGSNYTAVTLFSCTAILSDSRIEPA